MYLVSSCNLRHHWLSFVTLPRLIPNCLHFIYSRWQIVVRGDKIDKHKVRQSNKFRCSSLNGFCLSRLYYCSFYVLMNFMEPAQKRSVAQFTIVPIQNASAAGLSVVPNATILSRVLRTKSGEAAGRYAIPNPSALRHRLNKIAETLE